MLDLFFAAALILAPVRQDDPPCEAYESDELSIGIALAAGRPGGELAIYANDGLHGMISVPLKCFSAWSSSDPAVDVAPERGRIVIAPDATPGRDVEIVGTLGSRTVRSRFRIAPADGLVLTGFWSQASVDCGGPFPRDPLRELRINSDGRFAVTFVPFEVRQDYWGSVEFDPAAGRIGFVVDRGNSVPAGLMLKGRTEVDGEGQLVMVGVYFGGLEAGPPAGGCRYVFRKR